MSSQPEVVENNSVAAAPPSEGRIWNQCRPEVIQNTVTGKRVLKAAKLWARGKKKLLNGDATCVNDFGEAIYIDILGASFFTELIPNKDGGPGEKLKEFLAAAIDDTSSKNTRTDKEKIFPLVTRAYISFLLTATPQLRLLSKKEGSGIVRASADKAVSCDPEDPRLRVIRAGFMSQLGGDRSKITCAVDSRKAIESSEAQIKAIQDDPNSYKKSAEGSEASKKNKKKQQNLGPNGLEYTTEAATRIAWLKLQKGHGNLQLGDLHWAPEKSTPKDRTTAEEYLRAFVENSTECDPDMHSACYKLAIFSVWNIKNPKKDPIVPDLVRSNVDKLQPALEWYRRGVTAQAIHHKWLPSGMDEQAGPLARTWFKLISRALSASPAAQPNPLVPHPGLDCENVACPNDGKTPQGAKAGMCAKCLWANYCCKDCQVADWKEHKKTSCREGTGYVGISADGLFMQA